MLGGGSRFYCWVALNGVASEVSRVFCVERVQNESKVRAKKGEALRLMNGGASHFPRVFPFSVVSYRVRESSVVGVGERGRVRSFRVSSVDSIWSASGFPFYRGKLSSPSEQRRGRGRDGGVRMPFKFPAPTA